MRRASVITIASIVAAALVFGAAGCGSTAPVTPAASNETAADRKAPVGGRVSVTAEAFQPREVKLRVGQSVVWTNEDRTRHNVGGSGLVSGPLSPGDEYVHVFDEPGVYQYTCTFHPETEVGMVTVAPK